MTMKRKIFNVQIETLEPEGTAEGYGPNVHTREPLESKDIKGYLASMLELPQHPMAEEGQPFYVVGLAVEEEYVTGTNAVVTEETDVESLSTIDKL